jgi:hypothetical protein
MTLPTGSSRHRQPSAPKQDVQFAARLEIAGVTLQRESEFANRAPGIPLDAVDPTKERMESRHVGASIDGSLG